MLKSISVLRQHPPKSDPRFSDYILHMKRSGRRLVNVINRVIYSIQELIVASSTARRYSAKCHRVVKWRFVESEAISEFFQIHCESRCEYENYLHVITELNCDHLLCWSRFTARPLHSPLLIECDAAFDNRV